MRITGGRWRGHRLAAVPGSAVRPTTDRVRVSLFNILRDAVPGAAVADLCCGSGALGLEALSRGAVHVDFVDLAPDSLSTARENLRRCGAEDGSWRLHRADAVRWLRRRLDEAGAPLLVLADPPYEGPVATQLAAVLAVAEPARLALAVLEHAPGLAWPVGPASGWRRESRSYGRSTLTLLRPPPADARKDDHA